GRAVLTAESQGEQAAAGLDALSAEEVDIFRRSNAAYREKFGFPFIICARLNKKDAILEAFPRRLLNDTATEQKTALDEIHKIAARRLHDILWES
ncbi:MAG: 2-oxo-4-hydroxy-4-carboxy-5-ureidoimidazoline decarboxylase, partial [Chthoniobacterales bacterium]|nr:2-oxo-4-hydroxy-4-carboxy-5-ureidoimidazoline decarboxylase [Chthoniobacterales bacterium]